MLTRYKKTETAVHCCDPALSVLVVLVSRNVFHVVSALQSTAFIQEMDLAWGEAQLAAKDRSPWKQIFDALCPTQDEDD